MDQKPPAQRNTFVLVAVVLFNLLWIALLFLSCQADYNSNPTPTPEAGLEKRLVWVFGEVSGLDAANEKEAQTWGTRDTVSKDILSSRIMRMPESS